MSYENAPATVLVATNCCVCGRALVDSVSVETGIGPDCRAKYGYNVESNERETANRLVHEIAASWKSANAKDLVEPLTRLNALGFTKLSAKIAKRIAVIVIEEKDGVYVVDAPYSEATTNAFRRIPGRRWNAESKLNEFPVSSKPYLWGAIKSLYAGENGIGPKGLFTV